MPQARIPNASFIASAEFPILPFLAPRVFAEPLIPSRSHQHYGRLYRTRKEKETKDKGDNGLRATSKESAVERTSWNHVTCVASPRKVTHTAAGLLHTTRPRWKSSRTESLSSSVGISYADISSLTRQLVRSYSTIRPVRGIIQGRGKGSDQVAARKPSTLNQRGQIMASRREKLLVQEREKLAKYMLYLPGRKESTLLRDGRYRSLRRRITNLQHWHSTNLDLKQNGPASKHAVLIKGFAALDRSMYPAIRRHTRRIIISHDPRCARWSATLFKDTAKHELHQTWKNWMAFDTRTRMTAYERLLLYLLDRKPARAMQFIHVLANDPLLRGRKTEAIADALGHLSKIHKKGAYWVNEDWSSDKAAVRRSFVPAFVHIFRKALIGQRSVCSQDLLYNIADLADKKDLKKVFDCLMENRTFLAFDTVLHYANAFAEAGDIPSALRCLDELKAMNDSIAWEAISDRERLRWTCALILRKSMTKNHEYHETPAIIAAFVRLGITMDITLYNVVMHNSMEALDYATAFKVYNALEGNELKADKHTYSILLHGCASQSNPAMFSQFAQHCADMAEEMRDPWIATDYLYYIYTRHQNDADKLQTLHILEQAYTRFFSVKSLETMNSRIRADTSTATDTTSSLADATKFEATPIALYILLQAQIQAALAISSHRVLDLYTKFKSLAKQDKDKVLTKLAKNPTIWNAFLLAFCREQQFASASQLIKDMTDGSPQPNIYSWNIFMQAFFKTGQVQAAERVFEILRSRGVDPDQFTYGVLLRGYAKAQHVERVGEVMQHVDTEQEMDPDLLRSLAQTVNRNKLMLTLEKSRIYRELKAEGQAQAESQEEKERWATPQFVVDGPEAAASNASSSSRNSEIAEIIAEQDQSSSIEPGLQVSTKSPAPSALTLTSDTFTESQPTPPQQNLENPLDPEVQFRKLQEQHGILAPTSSSTPSDRAQSSHSNPIVPLGASLNFRSLLSNNATKPQITKELPKFRARRVFMPEEPKKSKKEREK